MATQRNVLDPAGGKHCASCGKDYVTLFRVLDHYICSFCYLSNPKD